MSEARPGSSGASAPTVLRMILSKRLKELRQSAGVSLDEAAESLGVTPLTIRRIEKAEVGLRPLYVRTLLGLYQVDPKEIDEFVTMAQQANKPGWWYNYRDVLPSWFTAYVSLESGAKILRTYEPHYVPGLLQTPDYARATLSAGHPNDTQEELDRRVDLRLRRQGLLTKEDAPTLWVVMEEAVLHRVVGGLQVMREQIDRLLEAAQMEHVTLDIVPFAVGAHPGAYAPFTYFRFAEPELPDVVYCEVLSGSMYLDQRADVTAHLEAHNRMSLLTSSAESTALLHQMRKEYT